MPDLFLRNHPSKRIDGSVSKGLNLWVQSTAIHEKGKEAPQGILLPPLPAIIHVSEEPLGELDVICMCVFEEGCS